MLRLSPFHSSVALLYLAAAPLAAQNADSVEVTPHNVTRPVTQNTGTGVGACQQFLPWAYDSNGNRARRQQKFVWSVSNSTDFEVDTVTGGVCARLTQLSDTVTTVVTATIVGTPISGNANFTVTPDPAAASPVAVAEPVGPGTRTPVPTTDPAGPGGVAEAVPDADGTGTFSDAGNRPPGPPPTGVTATATSPTTVRVAWTPVAGANRYDIVRASKPAGPFRVVGSRAGRITPQTSRIEDPGVFPDSTVHYQVIANYADGRAGTSATVSATTPHGASATNFTAVAAPGSIILSWTAAPGASGYRIQRGDGSFVSGKEIIPDTAFTDTGLPPTVQTYQLYTYYRVAGVGDVEGDLTQLPKTYATPKTVAPADFRYVWRGGYSVDFSWTPVSGAIEYKLLRADPSSGSFEECHTKCGCWQWPGDSSASDGCVKIGNTYHYKLVAIYPSLPAGESAVLRVHLPNPPPGVTKLAGKAPGPGRVVLTWTPAPGAQWYDIHRKLALEEGSWIALKLPGTTSSYTDTGLWNGVTYYYVVYTMYGPDRPGKGEGVGVKVAP